MFNRQNNSFQQTTDLTGSWYKKIFCLRSFVASFVLFCSYLAWLPMFICTESAAFHW